MWSPTVCKIIIFAVALLVCYGQYKLDTWKGEYESKSMSRVR